MAKKNEIGNEFERPNFQVRNPEAERALRSIASVIGSAIPGTHGFTLFLWEKNGGELFYISNANREDMINAMKEFIAKNTQ